MNIWICLILIIKNPTKPGVYKHTKTISSSLSIFLDKHFIFQCSMGDQSKLTVLNHCLWLTAKEVVINRCRNPWHQSLQEAYKRYIEPVPWRMKVRTLSFSVSCAKFIVALFSNCSADSCNQCTFKTLRNAKLSKWYFQLKISKHLPTFEKFHSVVTFICVAIFCDYFVIHVTQHIRILLRGIYGR